MTSAGGIIALLALCKFAVHVLTSGNYDYFIDELYTMSCGRHLDWGFVDIPPVAPSIAAASMSVFGESMVAMRIIPAMAGSAFVVFSCLLTLKMGGGRFAVFMTGLAVLVAPVWLVMNSFFAYDTFDQLVTIILFYVLACIIKDKLPKLWLVFGFIAGVGMMTKISMGFAGIALVTGLLLVKERYHLKSPWFWAGGAVCLAMFTPYIIWQFANGFPTLEYFRFYAQNRTYQANLVEYMVMQIIIILPVSLPLWIMGLWRIFGDNEGKELRVFGWMFLFLEIFLFLIKAKVYMISAFYVPLLAAGSVFLEQRIKKGALAIWIRSGYAFIVLVVGIVFAFALVPILEPAALERYYRIMPFANMVKTENSHTVEFPQFVADRFGWKELAKDVSEVYKALSPEERGKCLIYTNNYGEAGAIDAYGPGLGLPPACSGHLSYFLWKPRIETPLAFISIGFDERDLRPFFGSVELAKIHTADYTMPREKGLKILVCRDIRYKMSEIWEKAKHFD